MWVRVPPGVPFKDFIMSRDVCSIGQMAVLKTPLSKTDREDLNEILYDSNYVIRVNYEGTLIYTESDAEIYGIRFSIYPGVSLEDEFKRLSKELKNKLKYDESTIYNYDCIWYNGSDSYMDTMTLKEYKEL